MKIDLVTRREDLAALTKEWDALALADPRDGFFRTAGWYRAWIEHIRPDAEPFIIVARNQGGEMIGLAPLCRGPYRDLGFRLNSVFWAGREVVSGDFLDFVCEEENRGPVTQAMLGFLKEARSRWSMLVLGELVDGCDSYRALEHLARQERLPFRRQEERFCPYIALPGTFDEYLASLGSSTRYHIRRRMRDVEKRGATVQVLDQPDQVAGGLDTLIRLHLARWRKDNLPGTMARPGFAAFLRQICGDPPANSESRLYLMNLDGAPVAALLAFCYGDSVLYYQAGWEPDSPVSALSPAVVLMAHSIRDAIGQGRGYYEFLRGDEAYKSRWTKTYRKTSTVLVPGSFMAREYFRVVRAKDAVKHLLARPAATKPDPVDCAESQA